MENKEKQHYIVSAIFYEIEKCDHLLSIYEEKNDPLYTRMENWECIRNIDIIKKQKIEVMKFNLNKHLEELIELLEMAIKNKKLRCLKCKKVLSYNRLISSPKNRICLDCTLIPIQIKTDTRRTNQ